MSNIRFHRIHCWPYSFSLFVSWIFIAQLHESDAIVAKNSIPFDPFRLECPFFHSVVQLDMQRVESVEGIRTDIMVTSFCESVKKLFPSPRDPVLTTADEVCRWTPNFQIPGEEFDITHTCAGREFVSGISRQAPGEFGILCCKLKDRKKGNCELSQFKLPTAEAPNVHVQRGKRVLTALGQEKDILVAQFCDLEVMGNREVQQELILDAKVRSLSQSENDGVRNADGKEIEGPGPRPGFGASPSAGAPGGLFPPGFRPPPGSSPLRGHRPATSTELKESEEPSVGFGNEFDEPVDGPELLPAEKDDRASPAVGPPGRISSTRRSGRINSEENPPDDIPPPRKPSRVLPTSSRDKSAEPGDVDTTPAEEGDLPTSSPSDQTDPTESELPEAPEPRRRPPNRTRPTASQEETVTESVDDAQAETETTKRPRTGTAKNKLVKGATGKEPSQKNVRPKERSTAGPEEKSTPVDGSTTEEKSTIEDADPDPDEASTADPDPAHFQVLGIARPIVGSDPSLKPKQNFIKDSQTEDGGKQGSIEGSAEGSGEGAVSGTVSPDGSRRIESDRASLAENPDIGKPVRRTRPTVKPPSSGSGEEEPSTTSPSSDNEDGVFTLPDTKTGNVSAKSDGIVMQHRVEVESAVAPGKPLVTIQPPVTKPKETSANESDEKKSLDLPTNGKAIESGAEKPPAIVKTSTATTTTTRATTAKTVQRLECTTQSAWRDSQSRLVVACGQGDEIWVPFRCPQGQVCLLAKDSSFRLCCPANAFH